MASVDLRAAQVCETSIPIVSEWRPSDRMQRAGEVWSITNSPFETKDFLAFKVKVERPTEATAGVRWVSGSEETCALRIHAMYIWHVQDRIGHLRNLGAPDGSVWWMSVKSVISWPQDHCHARADHLDKESSINKKILLYPWMLETRMSVASRL